jgi:hypothetical protein
VGVPGTGRHFHVDVHGVDHPDDLVPESSHENGRIVVVILRQLGPDSLHEPQLLRRLQVVMLLERAIQRGGVQRVETHDVGPQLPHLIEPAAIKRRIVRKLRGEFPGQRRPQVDSLDEQGTVLLPHLDFQLGAAGARDHPHRRAGGRRPRGASHDSDGSHLIQELPLRRPASASACPGGRLGRLAILLIAPRHSALSASALLGSSSVARTKCSAASSLRLPGLT